MVYNTIKKKGNNIFVNTHCQEVYRFQKKSRKALTLRDLSGERGSRTYEIIENHKISIRCKLSVYKIVKFIETHRVHFDI